MLRKVKGVNNIMQEEWKTNAELLQELYVLRRRVSELEQGSQTHPVLAVTIKLQVLAVSDGIIIIPILSPLHTFIIGLWGIN